MEIAIDWKILIGQIINFAILFFILKHFIYKPFLGLMENRRRKIEEGVNRSDKAEKNLKILQELKKKMDSANEEARRLVLIKAEQEARKRAEESLKASEEERLDILRKASKEAEEIKKRENEKSKKELIDNAFVLAEKILKENIDIDKNEKITKEFLKKLKA